MAGLVPAIHVLLRQTKMWMREDVDARDERGHDGGKSVPLDLPKTIARAF
jgi:hypothetical protein